MYKIIIIIIIIVFSILFGRKLFSGDHFKRQQIKTTTHSTDSPLQSSAENNSFHCDGRIYCSEMTSCEEAKFFLENCPDVRMDGDGDGVPCEKQWCR